MARHGGLRTKLADVVMLWASQHASVWPSLHTTLGVLLGEIRDLEAQRAEAERLLTAALTGHGPLDRTFSRGEMADIEMALAALNG
jgi:hypothetical protein